MPIASAKIEGAGDGLAKPLQEARDLIDLVSPILWLICDRRRGKSQENMKAGKRQVQELNKQIDGFLDRILDASNGMTVFMYEDEIHILVREKLLLAEKLGQPLSRRELGKKSQNRSSHSSQTPGKSGIADTFRHGGSCRSWPLQSNQVQTRRGRLNRNIVLLFKLLGALNGPNIEKWCARRDSNSHGCYPTATSTLRVYQFRHERT